MFRKILAYKLRLITKLVLRKYKPKVIAITGSYGKSSTKEAVFHVLSAKFASRKNEGNHNTEIGVPLSILAEEAPNRDVLKWFGVFFRAMAVILFPREFPKVLVLEMGADRIGELDRITSFIKPDISVITAVGISHLEYFGTRETVRHEKGALIRALSDNGVAILNADNEGALSYRKDFKGKIVTYGASDQADIRAANVRLLEKDGHFAGTGFELSANGQKVEVVLEKSLGLPMVYSALAAVSVGLECGMTLAEIVDRLRSFVGLRGRLRIIDGISDSVLVDDAYNSAPDSCKAALRVLKDLPGRRKIAVLGKMAELGNETESGHREVGDEVAALNIDLLLVKQNQAEMIADQAAKQGLPQAQIMRFADADQAAKQLKEMLRPGDVVLFKASQSDYFEDIIKQVMARSEEAEQMLVQRDYTR